MRSTYRRLTVRDQIDALVNLRWAYQLSQIGLGVYISPSLCELYPHALAPSLLPSSSPSYRYNRDLGLRMFWNTARIWPAPLLLYYATSSLGQSSSNRTIDDQKGDTVTGFIPTYLPSDSKWNIGQTCATCTVKSGTLIDPGQVFDGTWHDATHYGQTDTNISVQVDFTGTAVYMYNILINIAPGTKTSLTLLDFYLDGDPVGTFTHDSDNTTQVIYNALVYKNTSLSNAPHSLVAEASGAQTILFLFDYVIYTVEDDVESSSFQGPTALSSSPTSLSPPFPEVSGPGR